MNAFKSFLGLCVTLLTAGLILVAGGALWGVNEFTKSGPLLQTITVDIPRGSGLSTIAHELDRQGAIANPTVFMIGTRVLGQQGDLKAGEFEITPSMSARDVMEILAEGKSVTRRFTIREGLTSYEIVQILNGIEDLTGEITAIPPEGTLLPNTWDYRRGEDRSAVITRLQNEMRETIDTLWDTRAKNLPFKTKAEALILASIIEKETGKPGEHADVAGVFVNRLRKGMLLQTDPTVIYAITKGKHKNEGKGPLGRRLLRRDLSYDSPYNTYLYAGLPPTPIANPGIASITAALNPSTHDYIYFVADGTGGHVFAKTLAEHNRNAAKWRKIRRGQ